MRLMKNVRLISVNLNVIHNLSPRSKIEENFDRCFLEKSAYENQIFSALSLFYSCG